MDGGDTNKWILLVVLLLCENFAGLLKKAPSTMIRLKRRIAKLRLWSDVNGDVLIMVNYSIHA